MDYQNYYGKYGPTILRAVTGLLFLIPGLMKIQDSGMITGLLAQLGFPAVSLLGWLVILSEVFCGLALIVGWKVKYAVWPLVAVLSVALVAVYLPQLGADPMVKVNILFHLLGIGALVSLFLTGPGASALGEKE